MFYVVVCSLSFVFLFLSPVRSSHTFSFFFFVSFRFVSFLFFVPPTNFKYRHKETTSLLPAVLCSVMCCPVMFVLLHLQSSPYLVLFCF